ncbi:MAG: histidine phosphatase family protein [Actinomycetes bacterium]
MSAPAADLPAAPRRLVLWRHGQTAWNAADRFQGHTDVPLDDTGVGQAERAARVLAGVRPSAIVASYLRRAVDTAGALSAVTGVPVRTDERLRETYGGTWQGRTVEEIRAGDGHAYDLWRSDSAIDVPAGGGETRSALAARVVPALLDAVALVPPGQTVVAVTHGGSVRAAIGSLLGLPMQSWSAIAGLANCCWSVLEERNGQLTSAASAGWRLLEHNAGTLPQAVLGDEQ